MATEVETDTEDETLRLLGDLREEASADWESLKKKLKEGPLDPVTASNKIADILGLMVDLATHIHQAQAENLDWASDVDDEIEQLKAGLPPSSQLLPQDAQNLKDLLLALVQNLRAPAAEPDVALEQLKLQVAQAVLFIEENTIDPDAEGDEDEEDDEKEA